VPFPLDLEQLRRTESQLGVTFPPSFVSRMLACDGGDIVIEDEVWSLNPFETGELDKVADDFVALEQ
jgi:hypothetical protein